MDLLSLVLLLEQVRDGYIELELLPMFERSQSKARKCLLG
jgi:hypothetical protein